MIKSAEEWLQAPVQEPTVLYTDLKDPDGLLQLYVGHTLAVNVESMSSAKVTSRRAGVRFYIPLLGEMNALQHAVVSSQNVRGWMGMAFHGAELAPKPFEVKGVTAIPAADYGRWRIVKQVVHYLETISTDKVHVEEVTPLTE